MCRKVVEYGLSCECCGAWFHATEQCCGDALANAFTTTGRDTWCCLNCFPVQGEPPAARDPLKKPAATIDHLDWRRAFRVLTNSCAGCGLKVRADALTFRCCDCGLAFHAAEKCTGFNERELARHIARYITNAAPAATSAATAKRASSSNAADDGAAGAQSDARGSSQGGDEGGEAPGGGDGGGATVEPSAPGMGGSGDASDPQAVGGGTAESTETAEWRCPTCLIQATGSAVVGSLVETDVTCGQEQRPIPLLNEVDDENEVQLSTGAGSFEYARQVVWRHPRAIEQRDRLPLADWRGRCIAKEATAWLPGTFESGYAPVPREGGGGSAYNADGQLFMARDCIFECNASSNCALGADCPNRVVGRGVSVPLQVVKTCGRGWGVRALVPISAGSFVCEYTGNMLLDSDAEAAGLEIDDSYLFNLDGEEKGQVKKRRQMGAAGGGVVTATSAAAQTAKNPDLATDASRIGSVARFINHCCEPNLFVQSVFVEYSCRVHRIALFAARDVLPYEELTYDYGYVVGSVEGKSLRCLCGAPSCRGYLF